MHIQLFDDESIQINDLVSVCVICVDIKLCPAVLL